MGKSIGRWWLFFLLVTMLLLPTDGFAQTQDSSADAIRAAAEQALAARPAGLFPGNALLNPEIQRTDDWALLTAALFDGPVLVDEPTGGLFLLAERKGKTWTAAVQGSEQFRSWLPKVPTALLDDKAKHFLRSGPAQVDGPSTQIVGPDIFSLPYATGESWLFSGGPHGNPRSAIDFARNGGWVRATADGVVSRPCANLVVITHADGWQTGYYHLRDIPVGNGQTVSRGTLLGYAWVGVGCGGSATGDHVHLSLRRNGTQLAIAGAVFGGWTVEQGANEYQGCLVKGNQRICQGGYIYNDGTIGTGGCAIAVGDGTSRHQLFIDAYNRRGGRATLGCPINGVHWWGSGDRAITIQDFRGGSFGDVAIIHDEQRDNPANSVPAYVIQGGIWSYYIQNGGVDSWLGPLTSDEFGNETGQAQNNFRNGYINYRGGNPEAVAWPAATSGQWRAEYHNGTNTNGFPTWVRNETDINYDWGTGAPGGGRWGVWSDNFSVRWTGDFFFESGTYTFTASVDDGVRVWVDGALIIDHWIQPGTYQASRTMTAGWHAIRVESFEAGGGARTAFSWTGDRNPNLALARTAHATSQNSSFAPDYGNDGLANTRWSSRHSTTLGDEWWWTNLGARQDFNRVTVMWESAYAADHCIAWWSEGDPGALMYCYTITQPGTYTYNIGLWSAQYVGVLMRRPTSGMTNYSLWETGVYRSLASASVVADEGSVLLPTQIADLETVAIPVLPTATHALYIPHVSR